MPVSAIRRGKDPTGICDAQKKENEKQRYRRVWLPAEAWAVHKRWITHKRSHVALNRSHAARSRGGL